MQSQLWAPFKYSDHEPISGTWSIQYSRLDINDRRIPTGQRRNKVSLEMARGWYDTELPLHTKRFKDVLSKQELEQAFEKVTKCPLLPWYRVRRKNQPAQWGRFWTREVQAMARHRSMLCRRWRRTSDPEGKHHHAELNKKTKRLARREKAKSFREYSQLMDRDYFPKVVSRLSYSISARKSNARRSTTKTSRVTPR